MQQVWQVIYFSCHFSHWWQEIIDGKLGAMTTILMLTVLLPVVIVAGLVVYRVERRTEHLPRIPLGFGSISLDAPDAARLNSELDTLLLRRRDDS